MAKREAGSKKTKKAGTGQNGGIVALTKELFQAAITLRGSVEPADYKRCVLPIIFLRFLSLRYDRRRAELEALVADQKSDYHGDKKAIHDPDEYRRVGAFVIPEAARWENVVGVDQLRSHGYVLTAGRYVGAVESDDDGETIEERLPRLVDSVNARLDEGARLSGEQRKRATRIPLLAGQPRDPAARLRLVWPRSNRRLWPRLA